MVRPVRDLGLREWWQEACQGDACLPQAAVGAPGARGRLCLLPAGSASSHVWLPCLCSRSALTQVRLCSPGRLWVKAPSCEQEPRKASCEASARALSAPSLGAHLSSGPGPGPGPRGLLASAHPGLGPPWPRTFDFPAQPQARRCGRGSPGRPQAATGPGAAPSAALLAWRRCCGRDPLGSSLPCRPRSPSPHPPATSCSWLAVSLWNHQLPLLLSGGARHLRSGSSVPSKKLAGWPCLNSSVFRFMHENSIFLKSSQELFNRPATGIAFTKHRKAGESLESKPKQECAKVSNSNT